MRASWRVLSTLNSQQKYSPRRPDLEAILHNENYDASMREGVRTYLREVALVLANEQQRPLTGVFYWVPLPHDSDQRNQWTLQAFFDEWRPTSDHVYVWQHVQDSLRTKWRRSFEQIEYCSLPRGHVSRVLNPNSSIRPGPPVIYHGGDAPIGFGELDEVRGVFNLSVTTPAVFDEVEQMIAGQPEKLSCQLKINLSPYNGAFAKKDSVSGFIGLQLAARQGQDWPSASQECCLDGARSRVSTLTLLSRTSFRDFG